jgi:hypothetical protein
MIGMRNSFRMGAIAVVGVAGLALAPAASAFHCYKTDWQDAAYAQVRSGTTWTPMSEFLEFAVMTFFEGGTPECAAHADEWTEAWMEANGVEEEPLINMRATAGGGAHDRNGKTVPPFSYLDDDDFGQLAALILAEPDCADVVFPEEPPE